MGGFFIFIGLEMKFQEPALDFNVLNEQIYYADSKVGKVNLLFLHGMGCNSYIWYPIVQQLKSSYRCINLDFRGSGNSPKSDQKLSLHLLSEDVVSLVEHLKLENVYIIAHSMGAQVAMITALKRKINIVKLLLFAPAGLEEFKDFQKQSIMQSLNMLNMPMMGMNIFKLSTHSFLNYSDSKILQMMQRVEDSINLENLKNYRKNMMECTEAMLNEPVLDFLHDIDIPVDLFFGTKDKMIPNPIFQHKSTLDFATEALKVFKNGRLELFPDKGHFLPIEAVNESVKAILKSIE